MIKKRLIFLTAVLVMLPLVWQTVAGGTRDGEKAYIKDRMGETWDVTQARSLGFKPEKFRYGIGRFAFTPLDESGVKARPERLKGHQRVIGFRHNGESHAYSVDRLRYHELANTRVGGLPVTAGY